MPGPTPLPVRLTDKQRAELLLLREDDNSRLRARNHHYGVRRGAFEQRGCPAREHHPGDSGRWRRAFCGDGAGVCEMSRVFSFPRSSSAGYGVADIVMLCAKATPTPRRQEWARIPRFAQKRRAMKTAIEESTHQVKSADRSGESACWPKDLVDGVERVVVVSRNSFN